MIHPTSIIDGDVVVGGNVSIWHWTHICENAVLGDNVSIGQCCYIGPGVHIGSGTRIQNGVSVFTGVDVGKNVFIGPNAVFTNDLWPRVGRAWTIVPTIVEDDVSIGANATILCGIRLGRGCMIGCGAIITRNIEPDTVVRSRNTQVERKINS